MHRVSWLPILLFASTAFAAKPAFETRDCDAAAKAAGARCGIVRVPENHARPRGRKIELHVLVLPATGTRNATRAQYDLEGGPGFAATDFLEFYAGEGAPYRQTRDVVLADMRGTGQSNPLRCRAIEEREKRVPGGLLYFPLDTVTACVEELSARSDPRQYSTRAAARDIDYVRRALGYEQLDLNAVSYGTTLALRYIADYPEFVHAAVLMGTVPASRTPPRYHAQAAQAALEDLSAECASDSTCRAKGDIHANLAAATERWAGSVEGAGTEGVFLEEVRKLLYSPASRARIPSVLEQTSKGNFRGFPTFPARGRVFADGLYLSITCSESFANMDVDAAMAAARATPFGAYRLERQRDACERWPKGAPDPRLMRANPSQVPVLFIAGELDPVAPPEWADEVAVRFQKGKVIRVAHAAHVVDGLSGLDTCFDPAVIRFFDTATPPDLSCFANMTPPAFGASP